MNEEKNFVKSVFQWVMVDAFLTWIQDRLSVGYNHSRIIHNLKGEIYILPLIFCK